MPNTPTGCAFNVGQVLLPMIVFPPETHRELWVRSPGEYGHCGFIQGDGVIELLRRFEAPLPTLYVTEVSEISGFAKAQLEVTAPRRERN